VHVWECFIISDPAENPTAHARGPCVRAMRQMNKVTNYITSYLLHARGSKPALHGPDKILPFLDRMNKRLEKKITFSAFSFDLDRTPLEEIQQFSTEMEDVLSLTLNFESIGLNLKVLRNTFKLVTQLKRNYWTFLNVLVYGFIDAMGSKEKAIQLLSTEAGLFRYLKELTLILGDAEGSDCRQEIVFNETELARLPSIFPSLRHFHCSFGRAEKSSERDVTPHGTTALDTFLGYVLSNAPNLEHFTLRGIHNLAKPIQHLPGLLSKFNPPLPVSFMSYFVPSVFPRNDTLLRRLIQVNYNQLRVFKFCISHQFLQKTKCDLSRISWVYKLSPWNSCTLPTLLLN